MDWAARGLELMWIGGLAAVPVALIAAMCSRWPGCRPATRHALWIAVLGTFIAPALTAGLWRPAWFGSERILAAADRLAGPARAGAGDAACGGEDAAPGAGPDLAPVPTPRSGAPTLAHPV